MKNSLKYVALSGFLGFGMILGGCGGSGVTYNSDIESYTTSSDEYGSSSSSDIQGFSGSLDGSASKKLSEENVTDENIDTSEDKSSDDETSMIEHGMLIQKAEYSLTSESFDEASAELDNILTECGFIRLSDTTSHSTASSSDYAYGVRRIQGRIPNGKGQALMDALGGASSFKISSRNISAEDVTDKYLENKSELQKLEERLPKLYDSLAKAETEVAAKEIQNEINETESKINGLKEENSSIKRDVDYSTVIIELVEDNAYMNDDSVRMQRKVIDAFKVLPARLMVIFGWIILFICELLPFAVILGLIWFLYKKFYKHVPSSESITETDLVGETDLETDGFASQHESPKPPTMR